MIAIHPGSGGKAKCWPLENYFSLIERLHKERDISFALLTGPAEDRSLKEKVAEFCRMRTNMLSVDNEDLMTVAALLAECDLSIGNDSGVSHLAAAVGRPIVALFGPTDPELWKPMGNHVRVLASVSLKEIPVQSVMETLRSVPLASSPDKFIRGQASPARGG